MIDLKNAHLKKTRALKKRVLPILSLISIVCLMSACSVGYLARAAYEEGKILAARRNIKNVISDPNSSDVEKDKLALVLEAREYAINLGLNPKESFTKFTKLDRDVLAWVLLAAKQDSFDLYTWWYPVVGRVPYKGFFERRDAVSYGEQIAKKGYEFSVRPTEAFSTLGWFNDPVLSTSLRHPKTRIANTVIHESFHGAVWIPGHVDFNESAANFVGAQGAADFFKERRSKCANDCDESRALAEEAAQDLTRELEIGDAIEDLYNNLDSLYKSAAAKETKIAMRASIFERHLSLLKQKYPNLRILSGINNAELIQLKLYLSHLRQFAGLFSSCNAQWTCYIDKIKSIKSTMETDSNKDPFELLEQLVIDTKK